MQARLPGLSKDLSPSGTGLGVLGVMQKPDLVRIRVFTVIWATSWGVAYRRQVWRGQNLRACKTHPGKRQKRLAMRQREDRPPSFLGVNPQGLTTRQRGKVERGKDSEGHLHIPWSPWVEAMEEDKWRGLEAQDVLLATRSMSTCGPSLEQPRWRAQLSLEALGKEVQPSCYPPTCSTALLQCNTDASQEASW